MDSGGKLETVAIETSQPMMQADMNFLNIL